jgi:uncharacterized protein YabN with tetrapyrrole methylase and pyrophosphatase domain
VVGTGIQIAAHLTAEARLAIASADVVLSLVADAANDSLERLNPNTKSLLGHYEVGGLRGDAYARMTAEILAHVREGLAVCVAAYGHPGLFVRPTQAALEQARAEGFPTRLLPGISAEDCLFADLGVDPARSGWQSYEATAFLLDRRRPDPTSALVLWQVGIVGSDLASTGVNAPRLAELVAALLAAYPPEHEVVVYEAASQAGFAPVIRRVPLGELSPAHLTGLSTLYVPPGAGSLPDRG